MSLSKLLMYGVLLGAVAWSGDSAAEILPPDADGWHTWQIDEPSLESSDRPLDGFDWFVTEQALTLIRIHAACGTGSALIRAEEYWPTLAEMVRMVAGQAGGSGLVYCRRWER